MQPLVSVVCSCFNVSAYLDDFFKSVYAQTYSHLEVIVIDDGSTDDTRLKLAELQKLYGFQLLLQANSGVSAALNAGLKYAKGSYVMTPDTDDVLLPDALAARVDYLERNPVVGCVGGYNICTDAAGIEQSRDAFEPGQIQRWTFDEALATTLVIMPITALYRMSALRDAQGFDPTNRVQDFQITLRIARQGYEIHRLPMYMGRYRQHGSGLSTKFKFNYQSDMQAIAPYQYHAYYPLACLLILNKALKKAVVQDSSYAWQLFRSVPFWRWDATTFKRFARWLRYTCKPTR
jgi:alpha-1,6-rhamnosyltransferase